MHIHNAKTLCVRIMWVSPNIGKTIDGSDIYMYAQRTLCLRILWVSPNIGKTIDETFVATFSTCRQQILLHDIALGAKWKGLSFHIVFIEKD